MDLKKSSNTPAVLQLVAVGDANVELVLPDLQQVPRFGQELVVSKMALRAAGSAANFAMCAASLGARAGFVGRLGIDQFGEVVIQAFRRNDVDTRWTRLVEKQATGITVALIRPDGERAFITYPGTIAEVALDDIQNFCESDPFPRWVHLAGYHLLDQIRGTPAKVLLEKAQECGATTSLDTGWDPKGWTSKTISDLNELLPFVNVFLPNFAEVQKITKERSPRKGALRLIDLGASTVVVKLGSKGCLLVTKRDHRKIPAFDVEAVDTTAAGDAFDAGFAVSVLSGATLARACVFANAVAALRITRHPFTPLFPNLQETTAFLMRHRPLDT